jgi:hypothetical protein
MGGAWSIWLASTVMGLKYFTPEGFVASVLVLVSIQSFLKSRKDLPDMISPLLLSITVVYGVIKNSLMLFIVLPYLLLLILRQALTKFQRIYIKIGALILTIPFPLMAGFYESDVASIAAPWFLLILTTTFNVLLADSLIFEKSITLKNYLALVLLISSFYLLSPLPMFLSIFLFATILVILGKKITRRQLGFSLLSFHILFSIEYLLLF